MMIDTRRTQIWICKNPTDMRLGYDGLHKIAKKAFGQNPLSGGYFVFVNRRRTSCKIYTCDRSGEVIICKRLNQGVFCRPNPLYKKKIRLSTSEFAQFFEGLNVGGRILESIPPSNPKKMILPFIAPYRRLDTCKHPNLQTKKSNKSDP